MAFPIVFMPDAQNDLMEIYDWYASKSEGLGEKFIKSFDKRINLISVTPEIYPIRYENIRCSLVPDFPYLIHYEAVLEIERIIVYRVFHTSRKPLWED